MYANTFNPLTYLLHHLPLTSTALIVFKIITWSSNKSQPFTLKQTRLYFVKQCYRKSLFSCSCYELDGPWTRQQVSTAGVQCEKRRRSSRHRGGNNGGNDREDERTERQELDAPRNHGCRGSTFSLLTMTSSLLLADSSESPPPPPPPPPPDGVGLSALSSTTTGSTETSRPENAGRPSLHSRGGWDVPPGFCFPREERSSPPHAAS
ncbi:hypothetical protein EYF80_060362 [Liparis tanakae]|uniref:Uncharacterized protein n=1 Tax=Liparis tanakae TaxID=230148 RepID=A0A4Z2EL04_9TELE|nr:hypothetical protein EYF80_060362 [Liparis tanakae]